MRVLLRSIVHGIFNLSPFSDEQRDILRLLYNRRDKIKDYLHDPSNISELTASELRDELQEIEDTINRLEEAFRSDLQVRICLNCKTQLNSEVHGQSFRVSFVIGSI